MRVIFDEEDEARDAMSALLEQFPEVVAYDIADSPRVLACAVALVDDDRPDTGMAEFYASIILTLATQEWEPPDNRRTAPSRADALRLLDAVQWLKPDPESGGASLYERTKAIIETRATGMPRTDTPPRPSIGEQIFHAQQKALAHRKARESTQTKKDPSP